MRDLPPTVARTLMVEVSSRGPHAAEMRKALLERLRSLSFEEPDGSGAGVTDVEEQAHPLEDHLILTVVADGPDPMGLLRRLAREIEYLHLSVETVVASGAGVECVHGLGQE